MKSKLQILELEEKLSGSPEDIPVLEELVRAHESRREWPNVVNRMLDLVSLHPDSAVQMLLLKNAADLTHRILQDPVCAIAIYNQILRRDEHHSDAMFKLLELYIETANFELATELLERYIQTEDDPRKVSKYFYTLGIIYRDFLNNRVEAVAAFNRSLDKLPNRVKAFEAIVDILTQDSNWKELIDSYHKMINRFLQADASKEMIARYYRGIANVYQKQLGDNLAAGDALELAARFDPQNIEVYDQIQETFGSIEMTSEKVADAIRRKIQVQPDNLEFYRDLFGHYKTAKQTDRAWCIAAVMVAFGQANHEMVSLYKKQRPKRLKLPEKPLSQEMWELLTPPDWNRTLGQFFERAIPMTRRTYREPPFGNREEVALGQHTHFRDALNLVSRLLGLPIESVYVHPFIEGVSVSLNHPGRVTISKAFLEKGSSLSDITFDLSRGLTYVRPSLFLAIALPEDVVSDLLLSILYVEENCPMTMMPGFYYETFRSDWQEQISASDEEQKAQWAALQAELTDIDLPRWRAASEQIANAVGLIACGDLRLALQSLRRRKVAYSTASTLDLMHSLIFFAISEEYFSIREALGLMTD